jgi:hypothetical protein
MWIRHGLWALERRSSANVDSHAAAARIFEPKIKIHLPSSTPNGLLARPVPPDSAGEIQARMSSTPPAERHVDEHR